MSISDMTYMILIVIFCQFAFHQNGVVDEVWKHIDSDLNRRARPSGQVGAIQPAPSIQILGVGFVGSAP